VAARLYRISFFVYWAAFAAITARAGQFPLAWHRPPELWQYPFAGVAVVCTLFALALLILYRILPAARFPWSWRRLVAALIYSALLLSIPSFSDQPPYHYVVDTFALTTFWAVLALSVVSIGVMRRANRAA